MSAKGDPQMTTLDRREVLKRVAYLMGGVLSAPAIVGVLNGCSREKLGLLTSQQAKVVAEIADIIMPRTDTPGAMDVGVLEFIDTMLRDAYALEDRERYMTGLQAFESRAAQEGKPFLDRNQDQRRAFVQRVHDEAIEAEPPPSMTAAPKRPFILMTKELTLLGFFMSKAGATQILQYEPVPGRYQPCVPVTEAGNGKAWALDGGAPT